MDVTMIYVGSSKIHAIRAIRSITGFGLVDCKSGAENPKGILVNDGQAYEILKEYLNGYNARQRYIFDWTIKAVLHLQKPFDMRPEELGCPCIGEPDHRCTDPLGDCGNCGLAENEPLDQQHADALVNEPNYGIINRALAEQEAEDAGMRDPETGAWNKPHASESLGDVMRRSLTDAEELCPTQPITDQRRKEIRFALGDHDLDECGSMPTPPDVRERALAAFTTFGDFRHPVLKEDPCTTCEHHPCKGCDLNGDEIEAAQADDAAEWAEDRRKAEIDAMPLHHERRF